MLTGSHGQILLAESKNEDQRSLLQYSIIGLLPRLCDRMTTKPECFLRTYVACLGSLPT